MYIMNALCIKNKTYSYIYTIKKQQPSTSGDQHHKPDNIIKHCYCISQHHFTNTVLKLRTLFFQHTHTHTSHKMLLLAQSIFKFYYTILYIL